MTQSPIYEVRVLHEVRAILKNLDDDTFDHLARNIDSLAFAPRREDAEELGEGFWLLRSGRYCILYSVDDGRLVVVLVKVIRPGEVFDSFN